MENSEEIQKIQNEIVSYCTDISKSFFRLAEYLSKLTNTKTDFQQNDNQPENLNRKRLRSLRSSKEETSLSNKEETPRPNKEETLRSSKEEAHRPNKEETLRPNKEETLRPNKEETLRPNKEESLRPSKEESLHSNKEEIPLRIREENLQPVQEEINPSPLKSIGFGKVFPVSCYENGKKIEGYKVQIKYYKLYFTIGPYKSYNFVCNLNNTLQEELALLKCNPDNYKPIVQKCFEEIKEALYKEFPVLPKDPNEDKGK